MGFVISLKTSDLGSHPGSIPAPMDKATLPKSLILASTILASSLSASAATVLVAGWDTFTSEPERNSAPTYTAPDTTVTMSGTGNWNDWNGGGTEDGASPDGTYGSYVSSVAPASAFIGTGSSQNTNLSLGRNDKPGSLVFTLTNDSGLDRTFESFHFDGAARFAQSARDWSLTFGGAVGHSVALTGTLVENADGMSGVGAARDWDIDLTGIDDSLWEAGSTATFTIVFTGGSSSTNTTTNGGHETLIDNIGFVADVVPEPAAFVLLGLGGLATLLRRRRC